MKLIIIILAIIAAAIFISIPIMEVMHKEACYHIPFDQLKDTDCAQYLGWQK